jgi:hypothetical protein
MAILDLALHPFAYVTIAELSDYWRLSRERVLEHLAAGHFEAIELGPGVYRVRAQTALAFERQVLVGKPEPAGSVVVWPTNRVRAATAKDSKSADPVLPAGPAPTTPADATSL